MNIQACLNITPQSKTPSMTSKKGTKKQQKSLNQILEPLKTNKKAVIPAGNLLRGVNLNGSNPFDTFTKIDDATIKMNFVKSQDEWDACLNEEFIEFCEARKEYQENKTQQNFDHMQEEMGDIFFTTASIAKSSGIDAEEAFRTTLRKNGNRINLMEKMSKKDLWQCSDSERKGLWNSAKRKIYDAQAFQYIA